MRLRKLLVITSTASAACLLFGLAPAGARTAPHRTAGARSAGLAQHCAFTRNLYSEPRSLLTACGYRFLARSAVRALPGSGRAYVYYQDGHQITFPVPPRGFHVLTATRAQLREYNLPAQNTWGSKRTWDRIMRKVRFTAPPTALIEGPGQNSVACGSPGDNTGCWAGYVATGHSNYNTASAHWTEPHIGSTVCTGPLSEALWVGLGGFNNSSLGQTGTGYGEGDPHGPWWEVLPGGYVYPASWDASPGDTISASVVWDTTTSKYGFDVIDGSHLMNPTEKSGSYNGSSADFILENGVVNGTRTELENVGTVPFSDAHAFFGTSGSRTLGSLPNQTVTSGNSNTGNILAQPGAIASNNTSFYVTQHHCQ
jgi:hypothetical protein